MWKRLLALLRHGELDRGLNAEVRFHIEMETEKNIRLGMSPDDARRAALRSFGPMEKHKEDTRDARGISWLENLAADLRYGARALVKHPGYALLAVLTLGLGIGANTAIFSVINGVLLKPLPYERGDRLVVLQQSRPLSGQPQVGVAIAEYYDYRERGKDVFEGLVEYHQMSFDLINRGEPDRVNTGVVSHNFFDLLGIKPILGRTFVADDDVRDAEAVLLLSHTYWRTKFGGDPNIVGQVFEMNDRPHRVIGILPNVPHYPQENDVYMPVLACPFRAAGERSMAQNRRAFGALNVFGRLKDGVDPEQAATAVGSICHTFTQDNKQVYRPETSGFRATAVPVTEAMTSGARELLLILLGITGLILLIACANVANLTLARMLGRDRELAMRTALGAGRGRLVRQLLTESTLLATVGGVLGIGFAWLTVGMLTTFVGRFTSRTGEITLDPVVLIFTMGISIVTGLLFGTIPALGSRVDLVSSLKQGGGQTGDSGNRKRIQGALIVAQVAVSVVLLVGAGLLLASFYRLQRVETGYRTDGVLSAQVFGNFSRYPTIVEQRNLYLPVLERLQAQPGVTFAAVTNAVPLGGGAPGTTRFTIEGRAVDDPERRPTADVRVATPQYFATIGVPVMSGRVFAELDNEESMKVAVINKSMVKYWDGADPIGSRIELPAPSAPGQPPRTEWFTVVGIVGDVRQFGLAQHSVAQIYLPLRQTTFGLAGQVLVRTAGDPAAFGNVLRSTVHAVDPLQPVEQVQTLDDLRSNALAAPRLTATLLVVFAGLAMLVTLAGIGGVIATSVQQRTKEFGLRMALGAKRESVLIMVVKQGLTLVVVGLVIGIVGALVAGRVLSAYLYQTAPRDPMIFAGVAAVFVLSGIIACLIPARKATTVDPLIALRAE
ncbi:MAG TPA: ABC transporter permease [Vicinamibacterales bacterium]|nr:ABC transporter permease [Vicinamibacterales bacterium]